MNDMKFSVLKVRLSVSFWFIAVVALYVIVFENALYVLLAVILHESAHMLLIYLLGARVLEINLHITDINIKANTLILGRVGRLAVALAGPTANLLACYIATLVGNEAVFGINMIIAIFQLVPCCGSDGGEVLGIIMGKYGKSVLKITSYISSLAVIALAVAMLFERDVNISLLLAVFYIVFMACK